MISKKDLLYHAEMRVFILSVMLYLIGVIAVLYLKPGLMFTDDGYWKEFGFSSENRSPFPFWAFVVSYAFVSFLVAKTMIRPETILGDYYSLNTGSHDNNAVVARKSQAVKTATPPPKKMRPEPEEEEEGPAPGNTVPFKEEMKPGYYKLNTKRTKNGSPKYVYMGTSLPSDSEDE
jgi:hypothetical protein